MNPIRFPERAEALVSFSRGPFHCPKQQHFVSRVVRIVIKWPNARRKTLILYLVRLAAFSVWSCFIVTRSIELITPLVEEEEDGYKVKSIPMQWNAMAKCRI